jgi:orotate phosphoribosyltransferase
MEKAELAKQIKESSFLTGEFTLRSGEISSFYWDKYRFESYPLLLDAVADEMQKLLPSSFDKLAGLEMGGIPLATLLSQKTSKPCLFVRKVAKTYGTCNLVEGGFQAGESVVVIEDVITVAGQVCASVKQMRELGLMIQHVICVIDRQQGGQDNLKEIGCSLSSVFTQEELDRLAQDSG